MACTPFFLKITMRCTCPVFAVIACNTSCNRKGEARFNTDIQTYFRVLLFRALLIQEHLSLSLSLPVRWILRKSGPGKCQEISGLADRRGGGLFGRDSDFKRNVRREIIMRNALLLDRFRLSGFAREIFPGVVNLSMLTPSCSSEPDCRSATILILLGDTLSVSCFIFQPRT